MTTILAWIVIGGVAGWLASVLVEGGGFGIIGDIVVGIVGALIGGFLSQTLFGGPGFTGFDLTSLIVAFIGACILLFVLRLFSRGRYNRTHV